jgi:hypothetical protein
VGFGCCLCPWHNRDPQQSSRSHGTAWFSEKNGHLFPFVRVRPCKNSAITNPKLKTFLNSRILNSSRTNFDIV